MKPELDEKLVRAFPNLYSDRYIGNKSSGMRWGFSCGDGWFDIIWDLSSKLEKIIEDYIEENPDISCANCACSKTKHYGSKTISPGRCLSIHVDQESEGEPPENYYACFCDKYRGDYPRALQVKEKFGGLRFYMTSADDQIYDLIRKAEEESYSTCEYCGSNGELRDTRWRRTLCDDCYSEQLGEQASDDGITFR